MFSCQRVCRELVIWREVQQNTQKYMYLCKRQVWVLVIKKVLLLFDKLIFTSNTVSRSCVKPFSKYVVEFSWHYFLPVAVFVKCYKWNVVHEIVLIILNFEMLHRVFREFYLFPVPRQHLRHKLSCSGNSSQIYERFYVMFT